MPRTMLNWKKATKRPRQCEGDTSAMYKGPATLDAPTAKPPKKREKMNITESVDNNGMSQVNETKIYQSKEIMDSLELMNKICK